MKQPHCSAIERLGVGDDADTLRLDPVAASLRDLVKHRLDAARHVGKLNQQVEAARQQLTIAQQAFAQIEGQLNETIEGEREAGTSVESETAALFVSYRAGPLGSVN